MNILFLFQRFSFDTSTIYLDLVRECATAGHTVYILAGTSDAEAKSGIDVRDGCRIVYVPLPDQFHAGKIKKGLVQLFIEPVFLSRLKKFLWNEKIDLIAYPTPPITLAGVVAAAKKHYNATTYLMLKDIFPQNAADLKMMRPGSLVFRYFKHIEKKLYDVSDHIGCMSPANVEYMKAHAAPSVHSRLELFPNTVAVKQDDTSSLIATDLMAGLKDEDSDRPVNFVIGGNLGKPQAIDFLLKGILSLKDFDKAHFMIIGDGTEAEKVSAFIESNALKNAEYHKALPRDEYEQILKKQDIGIISLSPDFTIPNFPSRLLSYMQMRKPVFVVTDRVSDIGHIVTYKADCGYFTPSDDLDGFTDAVKKICEDRWEFLSLGNNGHRYLSENYNVKSSVKILEKAVMH